MPYSLKPTPGWHAFGFDTGVCNFDCCKGGTDRFSFRGDVNTDVDVEAEADVNIDRCFGCLKRASNSIQIPFNCIEAVMVPTLIMLKWRAL